MAITKNARLFLERAKIRSTYRRPIPTVAPADNAMHNYPLWYPHPDAKYILDGYPPPDSPLTEDDPWHSDS